MTVCLVLCSFSATRAGGATRDLGGGGAQLRVLQQRQAALRREEVVELVAPTGLGTV